MTATYVGNEESYPKFDGFDVINLERTADIPKDFSGVMGVPISYLFKHCKSQFKILGVATGSCYHGSVRCFARVGNKDLFTRILIKRIEDD